MSTHSENHSEVVSNNIADSYDNYDVYNKSTTTKIRSTFFTLNNWTEAEENVLLSIVHKNLESRYLLYQKEVGESGTPHLQGFMYFYNQINLSTLNKLLPRASFSKPRCIKACILYCKKEKTRVEGPFEYGKMPEQGRRTDLEELSNKFLTMSVQNFIKEAPMEYVKYHRGLHALKSISTTHRSSPPSVSWFWGKSGKGKTRTAFETHDSVYMKDGTQWWDGYEQQTAIIIDDFDGKWNFRDLLRLLDRYPYQGQTKGGYVKINSPYIYITCEFAPTDYWDDNDLEQITRRITEVRKFE